MHSIEDSERAFAGIQDDLFRERLEQQPIAAAYEAVKEFERGLKRATTRVATTLSQARSRGL